MMLFDQLDKRIARAAPEKSKFNIKHIVLKYFGLGIKE